MQSLCQDGTLVFDDQNLTATFLASSSRISPFNRLCLSRISLAESFLLKRDDFLCTEHCRSVVAKETAWDSSCSGSRLPACVLILKFGLAIYSDMLQYFQYPCLKTRADASLQAIDLSLKGANEERKDLAWSPAWKSLVCTCVVYNTAEQDYDIIIGYSCSSPFALILKCRTN